MTTYHVYDPKKDVLKEGTRIRLAGREGWIIESDNKETETLKHRVKFLTGVANECWWTDLAQYPSLEVADEPLTISKRLKEEIKAHVRLIHVSNPVYTSNSAHSLDMDWLNSLEETE